MRSQSHILSALMSCGLFVFPLQGFGQTQETAGADSLVLTRADSISLAVLDLDIEMARITAAESDLMHRLVPQIHLSSTFGLRDLVFVDPATSAGYVVPRDAYSFTLSLSITEILKSEKHEVALLDLQKLQSERQLQWERIRTDQAQSASRTKDLELERDLSQSELAQVQQLLEFHELLFQQGKIQFDALVRTRIQLLSVRKNLLRLDLELQSLRHASR
jgi:Outer membrane efflux protein